MKHGRFNSDPNWPQSHCSHMRSNERETRLMTSARGSYRLSSLAYRAKKLELPLKTENPLKSFKWLRTMVVECCVSDFINNRTVAKSVSKSAEATPISTQDSAQEEQTPQSPWPFSPGPEMIGPTPGCITFSQNQPDLSSCRSQSKKNIYLCLSAPRFGSLFITLYFCSNNWLIEVLNPFLPLFLNQNKKTMVYSDSRRNSFQIKIALLIRTIYPTVGLRGVERKVEALLAKITFLSVRNISVLRV